MNQLNKIILSLSKAFTTKDRVQLVKLLKELGLGFTELDVNQSMDELVVMGLL